MLDVLEHTFLDSLKVLGVVFVFYILFSFCETKLSSLLTKNKKVSPLLGALFGLIPQCGFPILAADLFLKKHITLGTLLAIFIACSDEALPILLSSGDKLLPVGILIIIKFVIAVSVGFITDLLLSNRKKEVHDHYHHCEHSEEVHIGCCHHSINDEKETSLRKHLLHPLLHSLKMFIYVFIINFIFGTIVHYVGEENIAHFISSSKYLSPLFAVLVGLIPNCASSVLITNLYLINSIPFGACLAGLIVNAGLGMFYLLKKKNHLKQTLIIALILVITALITGYIALLF